MSVSRARGAAFTGIYSLARRSGLLKTRPGQWIFSEAYFRYKRHLEDSYHSLAARHPELFEGGHILDIGANIGYTSMVFAHAIDPAFNVYSFEPEEFNFHLLDRFAKSRRAAGRIVPIQAAAGDQDGVIELWRNPSHHGDHRVVTGHFREIRPASGNAQVPILKIDTFVGQQAASFPVRFIKVDVQGYELAVCKGMQRTLETNPGAALALEYSPEAMRELGFQPEDLLSWLAAMNYQPGLLKKDGSFGPADLRQLGEEPYVDLIFTREHM